MLKNIIINLLSNAIKYSPEHSIIELNTELTEEEFVVKIEDHGIGILEEEKSHLFSRFFRGKNASNIQGTGLGLNIVQRYVDMMHGEISFDSIEDQGTSFTIKFQL
jgi:signal transduction histidine kinase